MLLEETKRKDISFLRPVFGEYEIKVRDIYISQSTILVVVNLCTW